MRVLKTGLLLPERTGDYLRKDRAFDSYYLEKVGKIGILGRERNVSKRKNRQV